MKFPVRDTLGKGGLFFHSWIAKAGGYDKGRDIFETHCKQWPMTTDSAWQIRVDNNVK